MSCLNSHFTVLVISYASVHAIGPVYLHGFILSDYHLMLGRSGQEGILQDGTCVGWDQSIEEGSNH